jgi:hypothetical protein
MNRSWNQFHLQEFTPDQLRWIMSRYFEHVELVAQEFGDPAKRSALRSARGSGTWRSEVKRLLPGPVKAYLRALLGRLGRPVQGGYRLADIAFDIEPGDRLKDAFGLIAMCRGPRRDGRPVV